MRQSALSALKIIYIAFWRYNTIPVMMATRIHLFPFRTQKLSSSTAKVLDHPRSGRIASCRISKKAQSQPSCGCVLFLQLAIRHGRTRADFSKQWTPIVLLPEMSEDIRPVRALPEPPCFHLNGGEKASCRISKKRNRNESCGCVFFCYLLSE